MLRSFRHRSASAPIDRLPPTAIPRSRARGCGPDGCWGGPLHTSPSSPTLMALSDPPFLLEPQSPAEHQCKKYGG